MQFLGQWKVLYSDFSVYSSEYHSWAALPYLGVQRVTVFFPTLEYSMNFSGWDVYWMLFDKNCLRVGVWKDDDPDDPYYDKGREHKFFFDGLHDSTDYLDKRVWSHIPYKNRKRGIYVDLETAKKMGIL